MHSSVDAEHVANLDSSIDGNLLASEPEQLRVTCSRLVKVYMTKDNENDKHRKRFVKSDGLYRKQNLMCTKTEIEW